MHARFNKNYIFNDIGKIGVSDTILFKPSKLKVIGRN